MCCKISDKVNILPVLRRGAMVCLVIRPLRVQRYGIFRRYTRKWRKNRHFQFRGRGRAATVLRLEAQTIAIHAQREHKWRKTMCLSIPIPLRYHSLRIG